MEGLEILSAKDGSMPISLGSGIKPGALKMAIEILSKQHNLYND